MVIKKPLLIFLLILLVFSVSCTSIPSTNIFLSESSNTTPSTNSTYWDEDSEGNIFNNNYLIDGTQEINHPMDDDLIAYYKLDGDATDETGNYNGTNAGSTFSASPFDQKAEFNGTSSRIDLPIGVRPVETFTVSSWIYPSEAYEPAHAVFTTGGNGILFFYPGTTDIKFYTRGSTTSIISIPQTTFPINNWYNVVQTYDGTTAKVYINGVLIDSDAVSGNIVHDIARPVSLGSYYNSGFNFGGSIEDLRIYNRSLNQTEIDLIYANNFSISTQLTNYSKQVIVKTNLLVNHNTTMLGNVGIGTTNPLFELDVVNTTRIQNNLVISNSTPSASFSGLGDLYAIGGIKAMNGLFGEAQSYGAGLEILNNDAEIIYTNVITGTATLNATTHIIYDPTANYNESYKHQFFRVIDSTPSFTGATGEIISVINSTHLKISFATAGTDTIVDATSMSYVIYPHPIMFIGDNGVISVAIGESEDAKFEIHIDNGTSFHGMYLEDTAGANQHQGFTIDQNFQDFSGIVGLNMLSSSSTGINNGLYQQVFLEMNENNINNSHLHFIDANIIGHGENNSIDIIHINGDVNNIIHKGSNDVLSSSYYDSLDITTKVTTNGDNIEVFTNDNDWVYVGNNINFTRLSIDLDEEADVNLRFDFYYCNSSNEWVEFSEEPLDTTNGFRVSGNIAFNNPSDRGICNKEFDGTPFANTNNYTYIGLKRKRNIVNDKPVINLITIGGGETTFLLTEDLLKLNAVDTAPKVCDASMLGAIYFDISEDDMCQCASAGWELIRNGDPCN